MRLRAGRFNFLIFLLAMLLGVSVLVQAAASKAMPVGEAKAVRGGQITFSTSEFPKSFNYFVNNASDASLVFGLVYESLMDTDPVTLEFKPLIAKSWSISSDKKEFLIKLDPKARWADNKPITTDDVKFTYDTIMNPKNLTSVQRLFMSRFNQPQVIDKYTIKFTAKMVHYNNLVTLAGMQILPKHLFQGKDFNKAFNMMLPPGSGPYTLSEVKEDRYYVLTRRKDYWGDNLPQYRGLYNFEKIKFKKIDDNMAFEAFKKGDYDVLMNVSAKRWVTETNTEHFKKNWLVKQKVYNYAPKGFQGLAFNMRRAPFDDLKVRQGVFMLIDRKTLLEKIMYNEYKPLDSYWPALYSENTGNRPFEYDPVKAKQLLAEAGYNRLAKDGYLINAQGKRLEFTIIYAGESMEKHLTLMTEMWKKAGVKVNLQILSWPTLIKQMDEYKYDAILMAWSGSLFSDPEQLWHSKHLAEIGGSNLPGYKNAKVDQLIDSLPPIFDINERNKIIRKIDNLIYQDIPYALFWWADYSRVLYKNVFGMPRTVLGKYGDDERSIITYWWFDPVKVRKYQEAVKRKQTLPGAPLEIHYDQAAKGN